MFSKCIKYENENRVSEWRTEGWKQDHQHLILNRDINLAMQATNLKKQQREVEVERRDL